MLVNVRLRPADQPHARASPRPRDAAATRSDLLRAAMRLFTVYGYDRTTTRDIATAAGANVSLIARYFGSKEGLYAAVLEASERTIHADDGTDLVDEILRVVRRDAWPEFGGEHPLLLLLRQDVDDERGTAHLRRQALTNAVSRLTRQVQPQADDDEPEARLRGAMMLALITGVVALHAAMPDDPFSAAGEGSLRAILGDIVRALETSG